MDELDGCTSVPKPTFAGGLSEALGRQLMPRTEKRCFVSKSSMIEILEKRHKLNNIFFVFEETCRFSISCMLHVLSCMLNKTTSIRSISVFVLSDIIRDATA